MQKTCRRQVFCSFVSTLEQFHVLPTAREAEMFSLYCIGGRMKYNHTSSSAFIRYPTPSSLWIYLAAPGRSPNFFRIFAIFT